MLDLITRLIVAAIGPLVAAERAFTSAINTVLGFFVAVFQRVYGATRSLEQAATNLTAGILQHGLAIYHWGRWLIFYAIPNWLKNTTTWIMAAVGRLLSIATAILHALINAVVALAHQLVNEAKALLLRLVNNALSLISGLRNDLAVLRAGVAIILAGPAAVADWLAAFMWKSLYRYGMGQANNIASWFKRRAFAATAQLGTLLEAVIVRML